MRYPFIYYTLIIIQQRNSERLKTGLINNYKEQAEDCLK